MCRPLYDMLHLFQTGGCHMAVLTEPPDGEQTPNGTWKASTAPGAACAAPVCIRLR